MNNKTIPLDSLLRNIRWGHASNGVRRCLYNKILFSQVVSRGPISCLKWYLLRQSWRNGHNGCSFKKGRLGRDMPCLGTWLDFTSLHMIWQVASALVGLASLPLTSWRGLCQQPDWALYQLSTCARIPGDWSWSLRGHGPNPATSSTLCSFIRIFHCWWSASSNALACPWRSLEGLLMTAQNPPISYPKVLEQTLQLVGILVETAFLNQLLSL